MLVFDGTLRNWLIKSGYNDIADLIEEIMLEWQKQGKKTRRNWWDKLAGSKDGKELKVSGRKISIQNTPITKQVMV